ncbi:MAG: ABC transporter substrate-binding protein [Acidimicrobiia bacterium]|nr:ABC transporter substrate-binding protein [Acidimicrobiia bacterium]
MRSTRKLSFIAGLLAFGLVAAACGGSDADTASGSSGDTGGTSESSGAGSDGAKATGAGDGELTIGELLPETGSLAFLGPPEFAGAQAAKEDIDAAGGVNGKPLRLLPGDSGDTSTNLANQTVDKHLADGADAILGAASSGVSFTVIDKIVNAGVIHFSPANTAPDFTTYNDKGLYFRTAPSDVLQGRVLSDLIVEAGATNVGILARQDPYGEGLLKFTKEPLEEAKVKVTEVVYDPEAQNFDPEVDKIAGISPDHVVLIGFDESAKIIQKMIEKGIGPKDVKLWLVDGNVGNAMGEKFTKAGDLAGVRGTLPAAEASADFKARLKKIDPELKDFSYAPETYDAVIIMALAASVAGTDDPGKVAAEINNVTKGGEKCESYADCLKLIEDGKDIDYDGVGGPYEFGDAGEPNSASFAVLQYAEDNRIDDTKTEYKLASIG